MGASIINKSPGTMKPSEVEQTVARFKGGLNCTQAVLSTFGPQFGLDHENAVKVAGAFGSGMGMGETCGAVTGALMVIGLRHEKVKGSSLFSREQTKDVAQKFVERFKARNGATACRELLGCAVNTPEGLKTAERERHFKKRCPKFVQDAAEILEELLGQEQKSPGKG